MDNAAAQELGSIKQELASIIRELEDISDGVRRDFKGIGNEKCANCIDDVILQYRFVKRKLDNLDTNTVKEGFVQQAAIV